MPLTLQITNAGRAALVNAGHDGTNAVRVASVGVSPTAIAAAPDTAALPGELKRIATISGEAVAADVLHMVVRDESADSYTLRSFALYLEDGTLFAAYGQADPIIEKSVQSLLLLAIDVALTDVSADQVTFGDSDFLNPPATTERQGVVELATEAEAAAGTDTQRAVTPKGLLGAIMAKLSAWGSDIWRASNDGAGSGLDADLLDGKQGSWYADIPGRLGFTPADRAGDTFTGDIAGTKATMPKGFYLDPSFYLAPNAGAPSNLDLAFDNGDVLRFSRTSNQLVFITGGVTQAIFGATGNTVSGYLKSNTDLRATDDSHRLYVSGNAAVHLFDDNDFTYFDRTGNSYSWAVGGIIRATLGAAGAFNVTGPLTQAGNQVWHVANDGSGSGLDADMLDGQQGGDFMSLRPVGTGTDVWNGNGFYRYSTGASTNTILAFDAGGSVGTVQFNMSYTGAFVWRNRVDNLNWTAWRTLWSSVNDGSGSGLDADLLDGRQASEFALLGSSNTFTAVNYFGGGMSEKLRFTGTDAPYLSAYNTANTRLGYLQFAASGVTLACDASSLILHAAGAPRLVAGAASVDARVALTENGNQVWHVGNDGSGSGCDADMVDGWHRDDIRNWGNLLNKPGTFPPSAHTHTAADIAAAFTGALGANGYIVLPNGLIFQWAAGATMAAGSETTQFVAFPITFPSQCYRAFASTNITSANAFGDALFQVVGSPAVNGVTVMRQHVSSEADNVSSYPTVWAIGK